MLAMMADNIEHVISYWIIFQKFESPALGGFAVFSHWVPFLLFSVYAGALADRFDPRRIIQLGMVLFMAVSLGWGILILTDSLEMWHAAVLLVVHGLAGVIWAPAAQLLVHDIVGPGPASECGADDRLGPDARRIARSCGGRRADAGRRTRLGHPVEHLHIPAADAVAVEGALRAGLSRRAPHAGPGDLRTRRYPGNPAQHRVQPNDRLDDHAGGLCLVSGRQRPSGADAGILSRPGPRWRPALQRAARRHRGGRTDRRDRAGEPRAPERAPPNRVHPGPALVQHDRGLRVRDELPAGAGAAVRRRVSSIFPTTRWR